MPPHNQAQEAAVYAFIVNYIRQHGYSPSLREISRGCFMSQANVMRYLDRLEAQGRITRQPGRARSITLLDRNPNP